MRVYLPFARKCLSVLSVLGALVALCVLPVSAGSVRGGAASPSPAPCPRFEPLHAYTPRALAMLLLALKLDAGRRGLAGASLGQGGPLEVEDAASRRIQEDLRGLLAESGAEEGPRRGHLAALLGSLRDELGAQGGEAAQAAGRLQEQLEDLEHLETPPRGAYPPEDPPCRTALRGGSVSASRALGCVDHGEVLALARLAIAAIRNQPAYHQGVSYPTRRVRQEGQGWASQPVGCSGCLLLPPRKARGVREVPILLYCHGTELRADEVAGVLDPSGSRWGAIKPMPRGEETPLVMLAPFRGFAVLMPDYPGMGVDAPAASGGHFHPYGHAESLAVTSLDMVLELGGRLPEGYRWDGQLFICGYSEGGFTAMACLRELALRPERYRGLGVRAAACLAGPFNTSEVMRELLLDGERGYGHPFVIPYLCRGYFEVYGTEPLRLGRAFRDELMDPARAGRPGAAGLAELLEGGRTDGDALDAWFQGFPEVRGGACAACVLPRRLFREAWVAEQLEGKGVPEMLARMRENDLAPAAAAEGFREWRSGVPLLLSHNVCDATVPFGASSRAYEYLAARGGTVQFTVYGKGHEGDAVYARRAHRDTYVPAMLNALCWLEGWR